MSTMAQQQAHHRSHTDISAPATPAATAHDRFADLTALVIEPRDRHNPLPFERVIVNSAAAGAALDAAGDNPTIGEMLDLKPR